MSDLDLEHAKAIAVLTEKLNSLAVQVDGLCMKVEDLREVVNKSKGAIAFMLVIGGFFGWLISLICPKL